MTKDQKIIRAKAGLIERAKQLGDVSQACKIMGFEPGQLPPVQGSLRQRRGTGASGDVAPPADPEEPGAPAIEAAAAAMATPGLRSRLRSGGRPAWGQTRVSNELAKRGISISPFGVRSVWLRHDFKDHAASAERRSRPRWLRRRLILTEAQVAALKKAKADNEAHGEFVSDRPGDCGA